MSHRGELFSMATAFHGWTTAEVEMAVDGFRREVLAEAMADLQAELDGVWPYTRPHAAAVEVGLELARDLLEQLADGRSGRTP